MEHSEIILDAAQQARRAFPDDNDKAVEEGVTILRDRDDFDELVDAILRIAVRDKLHQVRSALNHKMRSPNLPRVIVGNSLDVQEIKADSWYSYNIGSRTLGTILGSELVEIATQERNLSRGHASNHKFAVALSKLVPSNKCVRESVSEKKLEKLAIVCGVKKPPKPTRYEEPTVAVGGRSLAMAGK